MRPAVAILSAFALVGCTNMTSMSAPPAPALKLVSFPSCDELLSSVREAAKDSVGPWGFGGDVIAFAAAQATGQMEDRALAAKAPAAPGQEYSGTNTHETGVDEPDMVKTDGKRIVVVFDGSLHVIDALTRRETHRMPVHRGAFQLLMHADQVLVLSRDHGATPYDTDAMPGIARMPGPYRQSTHVQLIDLGETPRVLGEYEIDAQFVDARQVGSTARIVVRSTPVIEFPPPAGKHSTDEQRVRANRQAIDRAPIDRWLPTITVNGEHTKMDCADINLPEEFSGASLVTLLSFDLAASTLSEGLPVGVMADGDTVYGNGPNLYLAHDQRWHSWRADAWDNRQAKSHTELYQFDVTSPEPVYVASGSVPGWLLNQYSLSEFDGVLRVATTEQPPWRSEEKSSSSVYTLRRDGGSLERIGEVGGLGKGERIYAVRFAGKTGYVVTFRRTDPLYTLDLSDPADPEVIGELKILGYSAYLHPVGDGRLIGVGQDATDRGRIRGTQVSLFDVGNLADPQRLDQYTVSRAHSEAEHDPHAFLYWPASKLLVIPVNGDALLLKVEDKALRDLGSISHDDGFKSRIRRSLVIGESLWTISESGAMASTLDGDKQLGWVGF